LQEASNNTHPVTIGDVEIYRSLSDNEEMNDVDQEEASEKRRNKRKKKEDDGNNDKWKKLTPEEISALKKAGKHNEFKVLINFINQAISYC